jgi:hypothetical protein
MTAPLIISPSAPARPVLVRDVDGLPVPPSEIVERCKRIHPALGLKFASGLGGSGWAITWDWTEHDKRRATILTGVTDPKMAYDMVGYLPFGCSVDEAPGYIERSLKQYPREEVSKLCDRIHHYNRVEAPQAQVNAATVEAVDQTMRDARAPQGQIISVPSGKVKSRRK